MSLTKPDQPVSESVNQPTPGTILGTAGIKNEYDKSTVLKEIRISQERQIIQLTIIPLSLGYTRLWEYKMACQVISAKIFIFIISQIYTPASKNVWINMESLSSPAIVEYWQ